MGAAPGRHRCQRCPGCRHQPGREEQKERWIEAQVALGQEDYALALALLCQLAALGDAEAMFKIGWMYLVGAGVAEDYASAKKWYERAAAAGEKEGYWQIGQLYQEGGPGLEKNYASAKGWYEKSIATDPNGYSGSYGWIGRLYEEGGPGLERDLSRACYYYRKAGSLSLWREDIDRVCPRWLRWSRGRR